MLFFLPPLAPTLERSAVFQFYDFTDGRTPWTSDQLVARPLPKHRTTQTQNKRIYTPNIHALSGIRTHDPGFRASSDSTCLRSLGYRDRLNVIRKHKLRSMRWAAHQVRMRGDVRCIHNFDRNTWEEEITLKTQALEDNIKNDLKE
jgi:hypothetical protein